MIVRPMCTSLAHHPVVITPDSDASLGGLMRYLKDACETLASMLSGHGALLFRGFDVRDAADFQDCVEALGCEPFSYAGGDSPRSRVDGDVYSSTDYPASEEISLHNEMSYLPNWPRRIFFYCGKAADSGGQTSLANNSDISVSIPTDIAEKFRSKRIKYVRNFISVYGVSIGKSWQKTYLTDDREQVQAILSQQGSVGYWNADGSLRVETHRDAFCRHPSSGADVWFNQAEQWHPSALDRLVRRDLEEMVGKGRLPHECEFGNGEPLDEDELAVIRNAQNRNKLLFDWEKGDFLLIDNISMMHGREPFKGDRRILAYLSAN